tara:strand:+ start:3457 stop:4290 length:834 start_codon:yes stop_codon:yes gene_type:complete
MMKKYLFPLTFLISSVGLFAQCPISVSLTSVPDISVSAVCKSTLVQLVASPSAGAIGNVTQYVWVVGNDTIATTITGTTNVLANNQNVVVYMQTTAGCIQDTVSDMEPVQTVTLESIAKVECDGTTTDVQVETRGNGLKPYSYEMLDFGTSSDGVFNDVPEKTYTLFTADSQGCKDTSKVNIRCRPFPTEAISPNGDGFNDTWQISNIQLYPESEVFIFDRWGQRVYHKTGYDNADGWGAEYVGMDLPVSTYYYLIEIKPENGDEEIIMRGPISVFR